MGHGRQDWDEIDKVTRLVMGNDGADEIGFGWIGLRWWCDLGGVWSRWWFNLDGGAGAGVRLILGGSVTLSSLSLSLSLHVWDLEMVCSENRNVNQFSGQSHKTHGQLKCFSGKFYFPCATKHAVRCKIISWNGFTPKQTQPKFHTKNFAIRPICWRNYYSSWLLMWSSLINEMMSFIQMYVWAS